jgi:hypothetical protein
MAWAGVRICLRTPANLPFSGAESTPISPFVSSLEARVAKLVDAGHSGDDHPRRRAVSFEIALRRGHGTYLVWTARLRRSPSGSACRMLGLQSYADEPQYQYRGVVTELPRNIRARRNLQQNMFCPHERRLGGLTHRLQVSGNPPRPSAIGFTVLLIASTATSLSVAAPDDQRLRYSRRTDALITISVARTGSSVGEGRTSDRQVTETSGKNWWAV